MKKSTCPFYRKWHSELAKGGWLGLSLPTAIGGRGLPPLYESIFNEEIALTGAPPTPRNIGFLARSLLLFGTQAQQQRIRHLC